MYFLLRVFKQLMTIRHSINKLTAVLIIAIVIGAGLRIAAISSLEFTGDERGDIHAVGLYYRSLNPFVVIAQKYQDVTQATLPYYLAVLGFIYEAPRQLDIVSLWQAKIPNVIIGILSIPAIFLLGKLLYGPLTGSIAAFLLALSTYHLSCSRLAVTSGDVCVSFFFTMSLYFFFKGFKNDNQKLIIVSGIVAGLAAACKFSAWLLIPIFLAYALLSKREPSQDNVASQCLDNKYWRYLLILNLFISSVFLCMARFWYNRILTASDSLWMLVAFIVTIGVYVAGIAWTVTRMPRRITTVRYWTLLGHVMWLMIIFTFIGSPGHIKPEFFLGAISWFDRVGYNRGYGGDSLVEWFFLIFFKIGVPFNVLFLIGCGYNLRYSKDRSNLFVLVVLVIYVFVFATFYTVVIWYLMAILPIALILSAREVVRCTSVIKQAGLRVAFILLICVGVLWNIMSVASAFPYYQFAGFKYEREYLRMKSELSAISFEGVRDAVQWIESHVLPKDTVGIIFRYEITHGKFSIMQKELMALIPWYTRNSETRYRTVDKEEDVKGCNYLIVSSLFGNEWVRSCSSAELTYTVSLSGTELFRIFKCRTGINEI